MATAELHDDLRYKSRSLRLRDELQALFVERTRQLVMEIAAKAGKTTIDAEDMESCFDEAYRLAREDLAEAHGVQSE